MEEPSYTALSTFIVLSDPELGQQSSSSLSVASRITPFAEPDNKDKCKESKEEINDRCHPL